jgi:outer membrane protein assembly factor BamB
VAINGNKVGQLNDVPLTIGDEIAIGRTIFRYTEDGKDDYSIPKRHNIFLLKIRQPVLIAGALIVILSSLFAVGKGISSISVINGSPKKLDIEINRYWSPEDNMVRASASEYDITSTPAIGDINNDGANEIVSFNSSGLLYAWNGKKGTLLWKPVEIFNSGKSSPVLADMNNDGVVDIVVLSDTSMLYIIDGQTGGVVRREILGGTIAEITPVVCDLDVDGKMDVVVCAEEGMVHFIYAPGFESGMEKYSEFVEGPLYASPVVITTKKLSPMVVVCSYNSKVYVFDGKTRGKKTVDLVEKTGKAHLLSAAPAVGDLDGDGIPEIVVQSNVPQYVSAIDITSFEVNWTYFVEPVPPAGLKHNASPIVTDINNNGLGDVVVFSANGIVYGLKGKTGYPAGELLWKIDIPGGSRMVSSPALYDFDKDGIKEMVFGTEGGIVYVVKSLPRRKEMEIVSMPRASNAPITSSVAIGDVNRDGEIEIVCSNDTNTLQILNTNVRTFKNNIYWPMYLGNALHTGQSVYYDDPQPYVIMIISGLAVLVLVLILYIVVINKNLKKRPRMVAI